MLQELVKTVIDSFVAPRAAARRVIDNVQDFQGVAIIFGLGFTLSAMILIVKTAIGSNASVNIDAAGGVLPFIFSNLIFSAVIFGFLCVVVFGIGRLFGGAGSLRDVSAAMAWHNLIVVVFLPFLSVSALTSQEGASAVPVIIMLFIMWLLANFAAEAHRFASVWKVAAVIVGLLSSVSALLVFFVSLDPM